MKVNFFKQHFLLYVNLITKAHGPTNTYRVMGLDTNTGWTEVVLVRKIKQTSYGLIDYTEVYS
jgi:hypothetical protein